MIKKLAISSLAVAAVPLQAMAVSLQPVKQFAVCGSGASNFFMIQPWYACLPKNPDGSPAITSLNDVLLIIFPLVESLVKIGSLVAVGVVFYMLIKMMTARGDTGKIASAGIGIRDAIIGLLICIMSIAIVNFVAGAFRT